jgi:hypothetical protein
MVQQNSSTFIFIARIISVVITTLFISSCASQLPPGGGEEDKIPPKIIEIIPKPGTLNYSDNYFEMTFSEYVDKRSVQEAIFVSPPLTKSLKYDWSGKSLTAYFQDTLKTNTTYTITIGTDVEDLNNRNKMAEPFSFAFSTGSSIDSGKISGKIYDTDPDGCMVFAYKKIDGEIDPTVQKPDYVSQVGKNGKYTLVGLGEGEYIVYAIRDRLRDFLFQMNDDQIGVQFKDLIITSRFSEIINCDFYLNKMDTIPPKLSSVVMLDRNHLLIEFNEPVDSSKISASNFYLYDSTKQSRYDVYYFFKGDARPRQYNLAIKDSLINGNNIVLVSNKIFDNYGNINAYETYSITPNSEPDTLIPKLQKIFGNMPGDKVDFENPVLTIKFSDGFSRIDVDKALSAYDGTGKVLPHIIEFIDDASFYLKINSKLKQRTEYQLNIDLGKIIDIAGNKIDSTYKHKFTTNSELDFSGVSGLVRADEDNYELFVELKSVGSDKRSYLNKVNKDKSFNLSKIIPGKYLLSSFIDKNKNSKYDAGSIKRIKYAEKFTFYPDTLNLRARWPVVDVVVEY